MFLQKRRYMYKILQLIGILLSFTISSRFAFFQAIVFTISAIFSGILYRPEKNLGLQI